MSRVNHAQALALCQAAAGRIEQGAAGGDYPAALRQAFALYLQAAEAGDADFIDPYLGLAFIFASYRQPEQAQALLEQASLLAPADLRVERLRQQLLQQSQAHVQAVTPLADLRPLARMRDQAPAFAPPSDKLGFDPSALKF